jgi:cobalt transporter subunit CbtB
MTNQTMHAAELTQPRSAAVAAAAIAVALGVFLILGAGFAHPEALHNAVHDTRHAFSFPCH